MAYQASYLVEFSRNVLVANGAPQHVALAVAQNLVEADLRGVSSHGVVRLGIYLRRIAGGMVDPQAEPELVTDSGAMGLLDGRNNFGAYVGDRALAIAMDRAKERGACILGVSRSNHFGTGASYVKKAVERGLALIVMSNASQTMPPTGGLRPFVGTNPIAFGFPTGGEVPFILDMATSLVARGKIIVAASKGEDIPLGWAVDRQGNPTTDANVALDGAVLPMGGPKGFGLSMAIDILCGVLTGAGFGPSVNNMYDNWQDPQNVGHMFIAIDIERFMPLSAFRDRLDGYIEQLKAEPRAEGTDEILHAGELEHRAEQKRLREGIVLPAKVEQELESLGAPYGIELRR
ncbi:Ldh family oxidoreductase [Brucella anthropi]|uniref:Ldh family oxidoreductase n=1 Tax=Brucella anthropi TaxID=529 RepID=UPI00124DCECE|nr:Ldh family oxidoreductase [Brucella anthropi]KAB2784214.1 Ldh family oxidoreductase [Brucella anthropi]KAB2793186.1 Ldh family oxidoreductase [Brucella anthropi]